MRPFLTVWQKQQLGQRGIVRDRLARTTANLASLLLGDYQKNLVFFLIAIKSHRCYVLFCTSLRCIITYLALLRQFVTGRSHNQLTLTRIAAEDKSSFLSFAA